MSNENVVGLWYISKLVEVLWVLDKNCCDSVKLTVKR
jgi:hypothetical protein